MITLSTLPSTSLATIPSPVMQTKMPPSASSTANYLPTPNLDPSGASISTTTTTAINFPSAATKKLKLASARPSVTVPTVIESTTSIGQTDITHAAIIISFASQDRPKNYRFEVGNDDDLGNASSLIQLLRGKRAVR